MKRDADPTVDSARLHGRRALLLVLVLVSILLARVVAVFTVAGNWDEFALLERAVSTAATGVLEGGGRPGLATLALIPFAADCSDEVATLRNARLLWLGFTAAYLAGLGVLLTQICGTSRRRRESAWLGVALLALVPAFLEWSVQVRTDQMALAFGIWGAVSLLASQRKARLAGLAGLLFGVGYLATQKVVYVGALAGTLSVGQLWRLRDLQPVREAIRMALCGAAFLGVIACYHAATTTILDVPETQRALESMSPAVVGQQMSEFAYYRNTIGFDQYLEILPTLGPHLLLLAALVTATLVAVRRRRSSIENLWLSWAVLGVGVAVGAFHASAFAYFWMTLGLFPAVALAIAAGPIEELLADGRERGARLLLIGICAILGWQGIARMGELAIDTQSVQRESLAFVHRNFADEDTGFHPEHAPFCRNEPDPIPIFFSQGIYRHFAGASRAKATNQLLHSMRDRPVKFVVQSFRLNQFPVEVRRFMAENYQPYRASVFVAGRSLAGAAGERRDFELIVSGVYRWLPLRGPQSIRIGDLTLAPGDVAEFDAGFHSARFTEDVPGGILVLALNDPPLTAPLEFYKHY